MRRLSVLALLGPFLAAPAAAQNGADIDLQAFRPAMDARGLVTVNGSQVLAPGAPSFGLVTTWGRGVLRFESGDNRYEVEDMITPTLVGAVGFRVLGLALEAGAGLPFTILSGDRAPDMDDASYRFEAQGMGDAVLHLKWRVRAPAGGEGVGAALIASVSLPTASESDVWLGDGGAMPELLAVADYRRGAFGLAGNAGVRLRGASERFADDPSGAGGAALPFTRGVIEAGSSVPFGLGASYAVLPGRFDAVVELFGAAPLGGENYFPLEALAGLKLHLARGSFLSFGGGAGLLADRDANPDARAFLAIVFEPRAGDRDGDGITDDIDRCPDDPEDRDGFQDQDGCPDPDNDSDRVPDGDDACPDDPEDRDGFQDQDGCPDPDNDGDLILDVDDLCIDRRETYNTVDDRDGCPDQGPVIERYGEIEILDVIHFEFDSAVIQERSFDLLRAVATTIKLNRAIALVEIQGHTDERGSAAYNLDLSQRRAESVLEFLAAEGAGRDRLSARGYGETRPLIRAHDERAWTANRRVQFIIARRR